MICDKCMTTFRDGLLACPKCGRPAREADARGAFDPFNAKMIDPKINWGGRVPDVGYTCLNTLEWNEDPSDQQDRQSRYADCLRDIDVVTASALTIRVNQVQAAAEFGWPKECLDKANAAWKALNESCWRLYLAMGGKP